MLIRLYGFTYDKLEYLKDSQITDKTIGRRKRTNNNTILIVLYVLFCRYIRLRNA
jgi:hypothetical protein